MNRFLLAVCSSLAVISGANAAETATNAPPKPAFTVKVSRETIPHLGEIARGLIEGETNQITFVLPKGFRMQPEASKKRVAMLSEDGTGMIVLTLQEPVSNPQEKVKETDKLKESAEKGLANAKLTDQFIASSGMGGGAGFEFIQPGGNGGQLTRAYFFALPNGILEASLACQSNNVSKHELRLNELLLSLRSSPIGTKPEFRPFMGAN